MRENLFLHYFQNFILIKLNLNNQLDQNLYLRVNPLKKYQFL